MSTRAARERRLVGALSLTLLALVGAIVAATVHDRRASVDVTLAAPPPASVSRIAIERPGRDTLVLARSGGRDGDASPPSDAVGDTTGDASGARTDGAEDGVGDGAAGRGNGWRIVAPCAIDANDARVAPLLDALAGARLDYAADDVDLAAAGLAAPLATVRLDGTAVALGGPDLGGERRYALVDGRVALVPEWTLSLVEGGLSALAEPAPFASAPTRVRRLDTLGAGAEGAATATDDEASADAASELDPAPWGALVASQVVAWPLADAPPTTRRARLEATLASGETRVVELVGTASWNALPTADGACARLFADADLPAETYR